MELLNYRYSGIVVGIFVVIVIALIGLIKRNRLLNRINKQQEHNLLHAHQLLSALKEDHAGIQRDLHDDILQSLYAVCLGLERSQELLKNDIRAVEQGLNEAMQHLNKIMRRIRQCIDSSHPAISSSAQFAELLHDLIPTPRSQRVPEFHLKMEPNLIERLEQDQIVPLLRIIQGAVSNCLRHARGNNITVTIQQHEAGIRTIIRDDGIGFDQATTKRYEGRGLDNMNTRVNLLGGTLTLGSEPGGGTFVQVELPKLFLHTDI